MEGILDFPLWEDGVPSAGLYNEWFLPRATEWRRPKANHSRAAARPEAHNVSPSKWLSAFHRWFHHEN